MLEKHLYDSWKSIMELYMKNRERGRMILELVEHGPLIWPMIEENGVTRTKKYEELSTTEKIQADCDLKEINIILQELPFDIYLLVNHHRFRDKVLLVEAQGSGKVLNEEGLEFLADPRVVEGPVTQTVITHNEAYQADNLDAYDSDCDDFSTAKAVLMANLSTYGSDVLSEIRPMLYDGSVIAKETNVISIADSEETLMLEEENFGKRFVPQQELSNEQAFRLQTSRPTTNQSAFSPIKIEASRDLPKCMRTRSSSNLPVESSLNPTTSNLKRRNHRRSKQPFILEESPVDTMADQRTMAELLRAPTEGYAEAIEVPPILAKQFELKHNLINMMTLDHFFGLEKDNPHDHIPSVKAVEEICVTCGGAHMYYQCLAAGGNTFLELRDNIQGYVSAAAVNYNQGNSSYRLLGVANQIRPPGFAQSNVQNNQNRVSKPQGYNRGNNFNQDQSYQASTQQNQVVPLRCSSKSSKKKMKSKSTNFWQMFKKLHINITLTDALILIPKYQKMLKALLSKKEKLLELSPPYLRKTFLRTARDLIDIHREEMILYDGDERLTLNMRHDTLSYSNQPQKESINMINIYHDSSKDFHEELFTTNHQSGNPTFSSHPKLTSPKVKNDIFNPEGGNVLIDKLLDLDSTKDPCEKLLNINLLIAQIKSLNDNPTPDHVLKPPSLFPIPVEDSDSFLEKSDTSLAYSDNSLPEYETFSKHMEETNSSSITTHADYSLPKYDSFLFEIKPDQGKLTSIVMRDNLAKPRVHVPNVLTTHPTLMLDLDFIPFDNSLPESEIFYFDIEEKNSGSTTIHADISLLDLECFNFKPDLGELTSIVDFGIRKNVPPLTNVNLTPEKDHSPLFAYILWIFLSFLTYPVVPPNLLSFGNEDTIFDPGIANYHFPSLLSDVSHRCKSFMKFNVYAKLLNESPIEILSSFCPPMDQ
nr:reverse transcriptase domain-containing protein [Tanacetum cinerariifolium]